MNRLNVQFTARQSASIEALARDLGTTKAGVLKTALALLALARRERAAGHALAVVRGEVVVKEIVGVFGDAVG